jgi:DNA polymerase III delta subunit
LLLDAAAESDLARALAIIRSLFASQDHPEMWLSALSSLFQRLLKLLELNEPNDFNAARQMRVKPGFVPILRRQAAHFKAQGLTAAILACFETEWAIKTSQFPRRLCWDLLAYRLCVPRILSGPPIFDLEYPKIGE